MWKYYLTSIMINNTYYDSRDHGPCTTALPTVTVDCTRVCVLD